MTMLCPDCEIRVMKTMRSNPPDKTRQARSRIVRLAGSNIAWPRQVRFALGISQHERKVLKSVLGNHLLTTTDGSLLQVNFE